MATRTSLPPNRDAEAPHLTKPATRPSHGLSVRPGPTVTPVWPGHGHTGVVGQSERMMSAIRRAVSDGVLPTRTPAFSSASFLACAVPDEPETIAPA